MHGVGRSEGRSQFDCSLGEDSSHAIGVGRCAGQGDQLYYAEDDFGEHSVEAVVGVGLLGDLEGWVSMLEKELQTKQNGGEGYLWHGNFEEWQPGLTITCCPWSNTISLEGCLVSCA